MKEPLQTVATTTDFTLRDSFRVISAYRWWLIFIIMVSVSITAIINFKLPNIYRAVTVVQINQSTPNVVGMKKVLDPQQQGSEFLQTQYRILLSRNIAERVIKKLSLIKHPEFSNAIEAGKDMVEFYYKCVTVNPVRQTLLVEIAVNLKDKKLATLIANAHAEEYVHYVLNLYLGATTNVSDWLRDQPVDDTKNQPLLTENIHKQLEILREHGMDPMTLPVVIQDKLVQEIKAQISEKAATLAKLEERYFDKHPQLIQARSELEGLRNQLKLEMEKLLTTVETVDTTNVSILDRATEPLQKYRPQRIRNISLAFLLSSFGGVVFCFMLESLTDTVCRSEDLTESLGIPFLGYAPHMSKSTTKEPLKLGSITSSDAISEAFRTIHAILSLQPESTEAKCFLITSTAPNEGKSTCAINLAITFAQKNFNVLLVEADLRRPALRQRLRLNSSKGLEELCDPDTSFASLVRSTSIPNLSVVTSRSDPDHAHLILSSFRMREFIAEMRQTFDRIIIDTSPVGAVSDALSLCSLVDGVIWVVRFDTVRKKVIKDAFSKLVQIKTRIVGHIINDIDFSKRHNQYYYSYRGYESYYQKDSVA